jgi:MYXO-CTERM domain-containing protein
MPRIAAALLMLTLGIPSVSGATVLFHDTWYDGAQVALQLGNCPGECDAVILEPGSYPFHVNYVYAIGGPGYETLTFDVMVLEVVGGMPDMDSYLGGATNVEIQIGQNPYWFEVDLTALGTPATVDSGRFAVAFCFLPQNVPCSTWGLGSDEGPPVIPDGGLIYLDPLQYCVGGQCGGGGGDYGWANLTSFTPRNWIMRASDTHWEPGEPTDDDAGDDDGGDDDTAGDDDDTTTGDDDTGSDDDAGLPLNVDSIEPAVINEGDQSAFIIEGGGFADGADVFIGSLRVMPVDVESSDRIEGAFPADLTVGYHSLCVENPDSQDDCLINALHVVSSAGCGSCQLSDSPSPTLLPLSAIALALIYRRRR